ncbi:MAG: MFS transporter [Rhizobiaceae bacterium]|nr:MFS transporter [Rhizobiaceae bacterium]MCV0408327.1 MFS transporter [Rhizobiaceae bacterium]
MRSPCETGPGAVPQTAPAADTTFCPRRQRRYVLAAAILASSLGFIDGSVVSIAIPAIRADLTASLADAQWISNAYALTLSALILAGGAAGDRFGLRRTFVAGIVFFIATSLLCAIAPNAQFLIVARALQGIGAALMVPGSLAIIAKAYPRSERGRAIGIWAAASALTTALGPVLGGFALSVFDDSIWRWIFAINLPLGAIAVYLLLARVPADEPGAARALDLGGAALATLAFGLIAWGLTAASPEGEAATVTAPWLFAAAGVAFLAGFVLWERFVRQPMVDLGLFRNAAFSGANAATFCLYFALSGILFYLPMLLIAGWSLNEAQVGFIFLPLSAAIALLSGPVGGLSDRIGPRLPIAGGSLVVGLAFAGLAGVAGAGHHGFWSAVFPLMVVMGLGMALVVSPLSTAIMTAVEDADTGAASGINNAVSRIAGLVAVASLGSVAAWRFAGVAAGADIPTFGEPSGDLAADAEALRVAASDAAFSTVAWVTAALCLLAALIAWTTVPGATRARDSSPSPA